MTKNTLTVDTGSTGDQHEHKINTNDQTETNFTKKDLK